MAASCMGSGAMARLTTRPSLARVTRPASCSTRRCFMNPGKDMPCGAASSPTERLPRSSVCSTLRRVGSASAANTAFKTSSSYLTIWLSICRTARLVKQMRQKICVFMYAAGDIGALHLHARKCVCACRACNPAKHLARTVAPKPVLATNGVMSHLPLKQQMPLTPVTQVTSATPIASRFPASYWYLSALLTLTAAAALLALNAHAQTTEPAAPAAAAATLQTQPVQQPLSAPKYAAKDIERAFGYIDANNDSRMTREEAAGFRGVAKHFDEADSNKDSMLSREEFENALNASKPQ